MRPLDFIGRARVFAFGAPDFVRGKKSHRRILVVNGHPDPRPERFCAALCSAYEEGAHWGGLDVRRLDVGGLSLSGGALSGGALSGGEMSVGDCGAGMEAALEKIRWADNLMIVFPLWLDRAPESLRKLFERIPCRNRDNAGTAVAGQVVRFLTTMEMPAFTHRASLRKSTASWSGDRISIPGLEPDSQIFIGAVNLISAEERAVWLRKMHWAGKGEECRWQEEDLGRRGLPALPRQPKNERFAPMSSAIGGMSA
jgi:putative NADPH-quinone reductase